MSFNIRRINIENNTITETPYEFFGDITIGKVVKKFHDNLLKKISKNKIKNLTIFFLFDDTFEVPDSYRTEIFDTLAKWLDSWNRENRICPVYLKIAGYPGYLPNVERFMLKFLYIQHLLAETGIVSINETISTWINHTIQILIKYTKKILEKRLAIKNCSLNDLIEDDSNTDETLKMLFFITFGIPREIG